MSKIKLTADEVLIVLEKSRPGSYSTLYRALGGKSNPASSTIKAFKALVPDVEKRLKANRGGGTTVQNSGKFAGRKKWPRNKHNPYRSGSYATAFDIAASFKDGLPRAKLESLHAQAMGRNKNEAYKSRFDCSVVLSVKGEGMDSERHKSCRSGYGLIRDGNWIKLVMPK